MAKKKEPVPSQPLVEGADHPITSIALYMSLVGGDRSIKLGEKVVFGIKTLDAAGRDTQEGQVVAEGLCFCPHFIMAFAPKDGGPEDRVEGAGMGGSYKNPNPGYEIPAPEGMNNGQARYTNSNGFELMTKFFDAENGGREGTIRVKGVLPFPEGHPRFGETWETQTIERAVVAG